MKIIAAKKGMLESSLRVCNKLLELKKRYLKEITELYEINSNLSCLNTFSYLEWKKDKDEKEIKILQNRVRILAEEQIKLRYEIEYTKNIIDCLEKVI